MIMSAPPRLLGDRSFVSLVYQQVTFLEEGDAIIQAAEIETSNSTDFKRYLLVVQHAISEHEYRHALFGIHYCLSSKDVCLGLVVPIQSTLRVELRGDGLFQVGTSVLHDTGLYSFKPVSIQGMWRTLGKLFDLVKTVGSSNCGTHCWLSPYEKLLCQERVLLSEWSTVDEQKAVQDTKSDSVDDALKGKLRPIVLSVMNQIDPDDIEDISSLEVRQMCEKRIGKSLHHLKRYIDNLIMEILGQMEKASKIFNFLYLGSEWNACDLDALQQENIKAILNAAGEIENFFPESIEYYNIRVADVPSTVLSRYFDDTYQFIKKAQTAGHAVLVHCKMGVSRSATIVIAFAMKEYQWSLEKAMEYVKSQRPVVHPNDGFKAQLEEYEGILSARNNETWGQLATPGAGKQGD